MKWKKIRSKEIFNHPRIVLIEDDIELPNGVKTRYLRFKNIGDVVTIICQRNDGKILLSKELSYPLGKVLFQFPGGATELGKNIKAEANRELMEETGFRAKKLKLMGKHTVNNRRTDAMTYVYHARDLENKFLAGDMEEDIENFWFSEKEIDGIIKKGILINSFALAAWSIFKLSK